MRRIAAANGVTHGRPHLHNLVLLVGLVVLLGLLITEQPGAGGPAARWVSGEQRSRLTPLTQGPAMDGFGAWSPDGRQIAFMRDGQILMADGSGRRVKAITSQPDHWDATPAWRPGGREIGFVRLSLKGEPARVMLIAPDGGDAVAVARVGEPIGYLAWHPDGKALYYTSRDRLVRVEIPGGKSAVIFQAPESWEMLSGGLAIDPDGRFAIIGAGPRVGEGVQYDLYRLPLTGGKPERLTESGGIMPGLDRSGRLLAYRSPREQTGIWLADLTDLRSRQLVSDEPKAMYFHPAFTPDGQQLLLSRLVLQSPPARGRGFTSHLYLYSLKGGDH